MSGSTHPEDESVGQSTDERIADLLAEQALFGLGEAERQELEALGVDPSSDPRGVELELAAAELLLGLRDASEEKATSVMPASLRMKVQAQAFQHFERAHEQPQVAPNTTTGANVVELAPRDVASRGGGRRTLWFLAAAAAALLVIGVEVSRTRWSGPTVASSSSPSSHPLEAVDVRKHAEDERAEERRAAEIRLEADDPVTDPAVGHSVLRWERGSTRGTLDVHGLPAAEAGRKREVWIVAGGTKKHVGDFASGDAHVLLTSTTPEIDVEAWMITEDPPTERVILKNRPLGEGPR